METSSFCLHSGSPTSLVSGRLPGHDACCMGASSLMDAEPGLTSALCPGGCRLERGVASPTGDIRCNVQLGPLQSPLHQAVPWQRDLFPLHLPRLLISCKVHPCLSGRREQISLIPPSQPCCCLHSLSSRQAEGPGRESSRQPGVSASPVPPHHDRQCKSKASPTDCSSSPCKEALCWVPVSRGVSFPPRSFETETAPAALAAWGRLSA